LRHAHDMLYLSFRHRVQLSFPTRRSSDLVLAKKVVSSGRDPTLHDAWLSYRDSHLRRKGRSRKTEDNYADHVERLMELWLHQPLDRKSTRLNSSHVKISYAVFCLKKKTQR